VPFGFQCDADKFAGISGGCIEVAVCFHCMSSWPW
jgi:hypothetical protein